MPLTSQSTIILPACQTADRVNGYGLDTSLSLPVYGQYLLKFVLTPNVPGLTLITNTFELHISNTPRRNSLFASPVTTLFTPTIEGVVTPHITALIDMQTFIGGNVYYGSLYLITANARDLYASFVLEATKQINAFA